MVKEEEESQAGAVRVRTCTRAQRVSQVNSNFSLCILTLTPLTPEENAPMSRNHGNGVRGRHHVQGARRPLTLGSAVHSSQLVLQDQ